MTVTSFTELARTVAANWKNAEKEVIDYCSEVARILKERHTELTKCRGIICLPTIDSVSPGSKEEAKPRNADIGAVYCLPTMDTVGPGSKVQLPQRATRAFGDQPSQQYLSMHAPMGIFPFDHDQDAMNSRDSSRTWLMDMFHQYQHNQLATIPNATTVWGNESLNCTTINMLQPMPSDVIREMQIMAGSARSQTGTYHQEVRQEFRAIMNASRRASISNMMTLPGRAPVPHGIRSFGEQPSPISRRYSSPEHQHPSEQERSMATYDIQELDVDDSNILDMWRSSKVQETHEF